MNRVVRFFLFLLLLALLPKLSSADMVGYTGQHTVTVKDKRYSVIHFHNWDRASRDARYKLCIDAAHPENIFRPDRNKFSYVKVYDATTGELVYSSPSPALTYLWLSPDSKYLIGLSHIKLDNPYQVVVFSLDDHRVIYKEHIAPHIMVMRPGELAHFYQKFPKSRPFLEPRTKMVDGVAYVDGEVLGMPNAIGDKAFMGLFDFRAPNPYSKNFRESVTNWVLWYDEKEPGISLEEKDGKLSLKLNDPKDEPFTIDIKQNGRSQ